MQVTQTEHDQTSVTKPSPSPTPSSLIRNKCARRVEDAVVVTVPTHKLRVDGFLEMLQQQTRAALRGLAVCNHGFELFAVGFAALIIVDELMLQVDRGDI